MYRRYEVLCLLISRRSAHHSQVGEERGCILVLGWLLSLFLFAQLLGVSPWEDKYWREPLALDGATPCQVFRPVPILLCHFCHLHLCVVAMWRRDTLQPWWRSQKLSVWFPIFLVLINGLSKMFFNTVFSLRKLKVLLKCFPSYLKNVFMPKFHSFIWLLIFVVILNLSFAIFYLGVHSSGICNFVRHPDCVTGCPHRRSGIALGGSVKTAWQWVSIQVGETHPSGPSLFAQRWRALLHTREPSCLVAFDEDIRFQAG